MGSKLNLEEDYSHVFATIHGHLVSSWPSPLILHQ